MRTALAEGIRVQAYCSMAFGCPFEGETDPNVVLEIAEAYAEGGAHVIGLADTLGHATPEQTRALVEQALKKTEPYQAEISLHMHDTKGRAQANCYEGLQLGVRQFDAAVGGCGGCNFAPGAEGNLSTQGLLAVLNHAEMEHGVDELGLQSAHEFLENKLGRTLRSCSADGWSSQQ
mmetsp:Transcript_7605/g.18529  ORF Transcript_7605/g.18529 Transcript_7605/m.18529 type:complete len:176 (+) Transcript_7605:881-1408(+)